MAKKILVVIFALIILVAPAGVSAQATSTTGTTTTPAQTRTDAAKEKAMAAKEAFKEKLAAIKDEKKQAIVENIDTKITAINSRRVTQMQEYLTKLGGVLDRVASKATTLKEQGKNTKRLDSLVLSAKTAISKAQAALDKQTENVYTANITTDALLRSAITSVINEFRTDLKAVFDSLKAARVAVFNAYTEAKLLGAEKPADTATTSAMSK